MTAAHAGAHGAGTAYRGAAPSPPAETAPSRWRRLAARAAPGLVGAADHGWYRRSVGGRWCRVRLRDHRGREVDVAWARVRRCPTSADLAWLAAGFPTLPIGWGVEAVHAVDAEGRCSCEAWP